MTIARVHLLNLPAYVDMILLVICKDFLANRCIESLYAITMSDVHPNDGLSPCVPPNPPFRSRHFPAWALEYAEGISSRLGLAFETRRELSGIEGGRESKYRIIKRGRF